MTIKKINLREIFDSRSESTLEVSLVNDGRREFFAQVPSGKSRGRNEAQVFSYQEARKIFVGSIKPKLVGRRFNRIHDFDQFLLKFDGSSNKRKMGGNVALGLSIAFAKSLAFQRRKEPWEVVRHEFFGKTTKNSKPLIFSNFINGGAHANNNLAFQEYLVVAYPRGNMLKTVRKLISFYYTLGEYLRKYQKVANFPIGDEGGYSLNFPNNFFPLRILERQIFATKLQKDFALGLDIAASSFYRTGHYQFEEHLYETKELLGVYLRHFKNFKLLFSIEDPFAQNDENGFRFLLEKLPKSWIVGDDLTTTNARRIILHAKRDLINAVIIKPNQIGTISETCEAIQAAKKNKLNCIISHRSGETEDNFILHLAKASNADGVKIGAPLRERMFKFNELIRLYH